MFYRRCIPVYTSTDTKADDTANSCIEKPADTLHKYDCKLAIQLLFIRV